MIVSQWKDDQAKTHRVYIQLSERQAQRLIDFLTEQLREGTTPCELNERGVVELFHKPPLVENYKGLISFVIV